MYQKIIGTDKRTLREGYRSNKQGYRLFVLQEVTYEVLQQRVQLTPILCVTRSARKS